MSGDEQNKGHQSLFPPSFLDPGPSNVKNLDFKSSYAVANASFEPNLHSVPSTNSRDSGNSTEGSEKSLNSDGSFGYKIGGRPLAFAQVTFDENDDDEDDLTLKGSEEKSGTPSLAGEAEEDEFLGEEEIEQELQNLTLTEKKALLKRRKTLMVRNQNTSNNLFHFQR